MERTLIITFILFCCNFNCIIFIVFSHSWFIICTCTSVLYTCSITCILILCIEISLTSNYYFYKTNCISNMYIKHEYNSLEIWNTKALLSFVHFTFFTSYSYYACRCGELESRVQKGISDL